MKCHRCKYNRARVGLIFCGRCEQEIGNTERPPASPTFTTSGGLIVGSNDSRGETVNVLTRNGLTYASLNGREVCPDILIVHASVPAEQAAHELAAIRNLRAQEQMATNQGDLEWDPD